MRRKRPFTEPDRIKERIRLISGVSKKPYVLIPVAPTHNYPWLDKLHQLTGL